MTAGDGLDVEDEAKLFDLDYVMHHGIEPR